MSVYKFCKQLHILSTSAIFDNYMQLLLILDDQVAGFEVIFEGDGFGFSQFRNTTPTGMLNLINCVQARSPICIRAIHLINTPRLFNMVFNNMVKPFLNERIKVRTK